MPDSHLNYIYKQKSSNIFSIETVIIGYSSKSLALITAMNENRLFMSESGNGFLAVWTLKETKHQWKYYYVNCIQRFPIDTFKQLGHMIYI